MKRIVAIVALAAAPARAANLHDPALTWNTVFTKRFAVHYSEGARNLAIRIGRIAEEVHEPVTELVGFVPEGRIDIVLTDASDRANGWAQVAPRNTIHLYLTAPTELTGLSSYDDWLRILVVHELTHICDIDQTWGFPRFLRTIFGKYIAFNGRTPQFLSEGMAVYAETVLTATGRGRSSYVAMLLRMAALEDQFFAIDQAHNQVADWPGGNVAYFWGGLFHLWLAEKYGRHAVRQLHHNYAGAVVPYIYYFGAQSALGDDLPDLWDAWREDELAFALEVKAAVEAAGVTPSRRLTHHGRNITGATYHPNGDTIIYSRTSPVDGSTVRQVRRDGSGDEFLVLDTFSPRFAFAPDGSSFYYSQNAINERFNDYNDLYRYEFDGGDPVKLVDADHPDRSLRARDPSVSPDGRHLVFVQNRLYQSWISVAEIVGEDRDQLRVRVLVPPRSDMQHASPRYSPDGEQVAVSTWFEGGFRDIVVFDAESGELIERITEDEALDGNPSWSPDGRYLLYESDRDGISNIYARELASGATFRVTRVVGGAFQADVSRDGQWLLFRNATGNGFDIHEMPFDPSAWEPVDSPAVSALAGWGEALPREQEAALELAPGEREEPYEPWRTVLPFQDNWSLVPSVYFFNGDPTANVTAVGQDVLGRHFWSVGAGSSWYGRQLDWAVGYTWDRWYPTLSFTGGQQAITRQNGALREQRSTGGARVAWPIRNRHLVAVSYTFDHREPLNQAMADVLGGVEDYGRLELGYVYSFSRQFPYSVGREHGSSLAAAARWYARGLGADFDEVMVHLDGRLYLNNPLFDNHVLALRGVAALAIGPEFEEVFFLGGSQGASFFTVQTDADYPLRGLPSGALVGRGLMAAYAEYRFPLWHTERGLWTVPVYFERLHGAVFVDAGNTFGNGDETSAGELAEKAWRRLRGGWVGIGVELRADLSLGWAYPLTLRGGFGVPVVARGQPTASGFDLPLDVLFYFSLGTAI